MAATSSKSRSLHSSSRLRPAMAVAMAILALGVLTVPTEASAQRTYTAAHKFRRGASNTLMGVLAIPGQMTVETKERGWAIGLPLGFGKGLAWFVGSELIGVYEFLTCPFPLPPKFKPIMKPEYPWHYWTRSPRNY